MNKRIPRKLLTFFLFPFAALSMGACGLLVGEPFIYPVHEANITRYLNDRATVGLRTNEFIRADDFSNFVIFYRIYISDLYIPSTTTDTFSTINPVLLQNFNTVSRYIDSDTLFGVNMHNVFSNIHFRYLSLGRLRIVDDEEVVDEVDINQLNSAIGNVINFDFSQSRGIPAIIIGDPDQEAFTDDGAGNLIIPNPNYFVLLRANSHTAPVGPFTPQPEHRLFINSEELRDPEFINLNFNADVTDRAGIIDEERRYTYAALFIVAVGMDINTFANVYSTPSLIHVFRLPN